MLWVYLCEVNGQDVRWDRHQHVLQGSRRCANVWPDYDREEAEQDRAERMIAYCTELQNLTQRSSVHCTLRLADAWGLLRYFCMGWVSHGHVGRTACESLHPVMKDDNVTEIDCLHDFLWVHEPSIWRVTSISIRTPLGRGVCLRCHPVAPFCPVTALYHSADLKKENCRLPLCDASLCVISAPALRAAMLL